MPAEIFADEGLTQLLNHFPRQTVALPATCFAGLFTSQTATTVPARSAVISTSTGVTEATGGGYARKAIANASWPAPASSGSGMRTTIAANGVVMDESTAAYTVAVVNGFLVASALTGGIAYFYANFSDDSAITINAAGFTVRLAPFWHYDA